MNIRKHKRVKFGVLKPILLILSLISTLGIKANTIEFNVEQSPNQTREIKGEVTDESGLPIIGATVLEEDSGNGTITDIDGKYIINVKPNSKLLFSYIGYLSQRVTITSQEKLNIRLKEDSKILDEVVIVGYGTQKKGSITGSVAGIDTKDLVKAPVSDLYISLAGKLPGLRVVTRSGMPGQSETEIDIRGFGNALIIVDGVPGDFSQLDPNEIANISILKDASAAVYGVQAANGVVLVTTKRGESGKTKVNFNSTFNWQRPTIYPKMVNAAEFVELTDEDKINKGQTPLYGPEELAKWRAGGQGYKSTDWYKEVARDWAPMQLYNVNVNGGSEKLKFFTSLGYLNQGGMWKSDDLRFDRFNFRTNVDAKLGAGFSTSVSLSGIKESKRSPSSTPGDIMAAIKRAYPVDEPYANGNKEYLAKNNNPYYHPVTLTEKDITGYSNQTRETFEGSISFNYDAGQFIKGLSANVKGYYSTIYIQNKTLFKKFHLYSYDDVSQEYNIEYTGSDPSSLFESNYRYQYKVFQGSINYEKTINKHDFNALFLVETKQNSGNDLGAYREFSIDVIDELNSGMDSNKDNNGTSWYTGNIGYIGRLNYNYDSKYLAEVSFRYDGSSNFPPEADGVSFLQFLLDGEFLRRVL